MIASGQTHGTIDVVASNIHGAGATELALSLIPQLETEAGDKIGTIWIPQAGRLTDNLCTSSQYRRYRRCLPNAASRLIECFIIAPFIYRAERILVLGDLPLFIRRQQVVLVHTPFVIPGAQTFSLVAKIKAWAIRTTFKITSRRAHRIILQTSAMAQAIVRHYPILANKIVIIPQPPPTWLNNEVFVPSARQAKRPLRLFYPAADYPHKNHRILQDILKVSDIEKYLSDLTVTVKSNLFYKCSPIVKAIGHIDSARMVNEYRKTDALVFPSLEESYGLPLIEAMHIGLPILCSDRPYAHVLCDNQAIYFDPLSVDSLLLAIKDLRERLDYGWRPNWEIQLKRLPTNWSEVARRMLALFDED